MIQTPMLISSASSEKLSGKLVSGKDIYCKGLFLSARWFVFSQVASGGTNVIVLPDRESAEYCSSDLYALTDGDIVFYLPDSGKGVERSNYKSSLGVQRTSAVGRIMSNADNSSRLFIVTIPRRWKNWFRLRTKSTPLSLKSLKVRRFRMTPSATYLPARGSRGWISSLLRGNIQ